jgi:hypothetical protein
MKKTAPVISALAIAAAAIGISFAPPAAADTSNCQNAGATTVCGQGGVTGAGPSAGAPSAPPSAPAGGGCLTQYGTYQNCNMGK